MNSMHDMGGMHGLGPIEYVEEQSWYREEWETRVWGLNRAVSPWGHGRWSHINFRYEHETVPAYDYLRMPYHERIFHVMVNRLLRSGLITEEELATGEPDWSRPRPELLHAPDGPRQSARIDEPMERKFALGERVRARNIHPKGHTRLPRYTRGRTGTIVRDNGVFPLQDTDEHGASVGWRPQPVYTVRFAARELWGDEASPRDFIYVEMWEEYLERPDTCD